MDDNKATVRRRGVALDVTELYTENGPSTLYYADATPAKPATLDYGVARLDPRNPTISATLGDADVTTDNYRDVRGGGQYTTTTQMEIERDQRIFIENVNATADSLHWINSYSKKWLGVSPTNNYGSKLKTLQTPKSLSDKRVGMFNNTTDENYMIAALKSFNVSLEATNSNLVRTYKAAPAASVRAVRSVDAASTDPSARAPPAPFAGAPGLAARPDDLLRVTTAGLPASTAPSARAPADAARAALAATAPLADAARAALAATAPLADAARAAPPVLVVPSAPRPVVAAHRADAAPTAPSATAPGGGADLSATAPVAPTNFQGGSGSFAEELIRFINNTKKFFDITKSYIADSVNKRKFSIEEGNSITNELDNVEKEIDSMKTTISSKINTLTTNDERTVFNNLLQKTNNGLRASIRFYTSTDENKKYERYDRVIKLVDETIDLANFSPRQKNSVKTIIGDFSNAYKNFEITTDTKHRIESRKNNLNLINYLRHIFDTILKLTNLSSHQKIVAMSYLNDLFAIYYKFSNKTDLGFHFDLLSEIKMNENFQHIISTSLSLIDLPSSKKDAVSDILDDSLDLLESLSKLF
jgi:hypothetical protein